MIKKAFALFWVVALAAAAAPPGWSRAQSRGDGDVVQLDADLVTIDITATNARGDFVTDLKPGELKLFEDGQPREVAFFDASSQKGLSRPLAVVLALDVSGSIKPEEIGLQRQSAMRFVDLVRPESLFSVITFSHEVRVLQKFTSEARLVGRAFDKISDVGGSTRLLDTIDQTITMLRKAPAIRAGRRLRRVVVVITDGYDNASVIDPTELARRAAAAGVTVYSITLPSYYRTLTGERARAITILDVTRVVPATGGMDFSADSYDFTPIFRAIAEEITASYQLAFYPPETNRRDGKFHQLRVEVTRPGVALRASRQGYQAPAKK
jgi:Ca-activated chloride channel family protein